MSTTGFIGASTVIVVAGVWSQDSKLDPTIVVGGAVVAFSLTIMNEFSPLLAERFAVLIFMASLIYYAIPLAQKVGLVESGKSTGGKPKPKKKSGGHK